MEYGERLRRHVRGYRTEGHLPRHQHRRSTGKHPFLVVLVDGEEDPTQGDHDRADAGTGRIYPRHRTARRSAHRQGPQAQRSSGFRHGRPPGRDRRTFPRPVARQGVQDPVHRRLDLGRLRRPRRIPRRPPINSNGLACVTRT
ncbi:MAG: hypothetical protein MZW92_02745 [Comamonadaceae bacterium]|nr:hypothetical protein [Comamonadaceae bacterium]